MLTLSTILSIISDIGPALPGVVTEAENVFNDIAHGEGGMAKIEKVLSDLKNFGSVIASAVNVAKQVQAANTSGANTVPSAGG